MTDHDSWSPRKVAIIGVGLLGGSFGLAVRQAFPSCQVIGVSRRAPSRQQALQRAAVQQATDDATAACDGADLIVLATPVDRVARYVQQLAPHCPSDALITDLGSTKASIVAAAEADPLGRQMFVGSHPIAGGEQTGAQHARQELFRGKTVVLTPTERTDARRLQRAGRIWAALGASVVQMSPQAHDQAVAAVSHVPHLLASLLASLPSEEARRLAGSGWCDTTRVASGDPEMWAAICQENAAAIVAEIDRLRQSLDQLRQRIADGETAAVHDVLQQAKQARDRVLSRPPAAADRPLTDDV